MYTLTLQAVDLTGQPITENYGNLIGGGSYTPGASNLIKAEINEAFRFKYWTIDSDVEGSKNVWRTADKNYIVSVIKPELIVKAVLEPTGAWAAIQDTILEFKNSAQVNGTKIEVLKDSEACYYEYDEERKAFKTVIIN